MKIKCTSLPSIQYGPTVTINKEYKVERDKLGFEFIVDDKNFEWVMPVGIAKKESHHISEFGNWILL